MNNIYIHNVILLIYVACFALKESSSQRNKAWIYIDVYGRKFQMHFPNWT